MTAPFPHVFEPASRTDALTLVLLHGTGGDEHDLLPLGRMLDADAALLSPRGQVSEGGMPRWFRRHAEGVFDHDDVRVRADELAGFVEASVRTQVGATDRIVAVGFSNGANIAGALLWRHQGLLRGAVLLSPMVPLPDPLPNLDGTAVLIGAGRSDPVVPAEQTEQLASALSGAGAAVEVAWHDAGHGIPKSLVEDARRWLAHVRAVTATDILP